MTVAEKCARKIAERLFVFSFLPAASTICILDEEIPVDSQTKGGDSILSSSGIQEIARIILEAIEEEGK